MSSQKVARWQRTGQRANVLHGLRAAAVSPNSRHSVWQTTCDFIMPVHCSNAVEMSYLHLHMLLQPFVGELVAAAMADSGNKRKWTLSCELCFPLSSRWPIFRIFLYLFLFNFGRLVGLSKADLHVKVLLVGGRVGPSTMVSREK